MDLRSSILGNEHLTLGHGYGNQISELFEVHPLLISILQ